MDIRTVSAVTAGFRRVMAVSEDPAEFFAVLRVEPEGGLLRGIVGQLGGDLPVARQMILRQDFLREAMERNLDGMLGRWAIALESGFGLKSPDSRDAGPSLQSQSSLWQSFLAGGDAGIAGGDRGRRDIVSCPAEEIAFLMDHGMLRRRMGEESYGVHRVPGLQKSEPVSGFEALKVQAQIHRAFPDFPAPADIDVDRAREALASVARPGAAAVAWYGIRDAKKGEMRLQAAKSYPVLADLIAEKTSISRKVDRQEPIAEAILAQTGLSRASLKRLGRIRNPIPVEHVFQRGQRAQGADALGVVRDHRMIVTGVASRDTVLRQLAAMPPDRTPQDDAEWQAFHTVLSGCAIPLSRALGIPEGQILDASKGKWGAFKDQLARAADFEPAEFDRRAITVSTVDAIETIEDFGRTVVLPQVLLSIESTGQDLPPVTPEYLRSAFRASTEILIGKSKNVGVNLFELARRHASRIPALMQAEGNFDDGVADASRQQHSVWEKYGDQGFPLLTEAWQASNGLVVMPFRDFDDMREESRRLSHCVGQLYLGAARTTDGHFFSVRPAGLATSLSTVQLSRLPDSGNPDEIRIIQHRGQSNRQPSDEALGAVEEWMEEIRSGRLHLNSREIQGWREYLRSLRSPEQVDRIPPRVTWSSALESDWSDVEKRQASWEEWRGIVGGSVGKPDTPAGIFRFAEARALLEEMSPAAASILARQAREARAAREDTPSP